MDVGLLYGYTLGAERAYIRAASGLALTQGEKYLKSINQYEDWYGNIRTTTSWDTEDFSTVGIPWSVTSGKSFSMGNLVQAGGFLVHLWAGG